MVVCVCVCAGMEGCGVLDHENIGAVRQPNTFSHIYISVGVSIHNILHVCVYI